MSEELLKKCHITLVQLNQMIGGHEQVTLLIEEIADHLNPKKKFMEWVATLPDIPLNQLKILQGVTLEPEYMNAVEDELRRR